VPLTGNFASYCPHLLDGDHLTLTDRLNVQGQRLYDSTIGALHCVEPQGARLMQALQGGCSFASLHDISRKEGIDDLQLSSLLGFLNLTGGLARHRSARGQVQAVKRSALGVLAGVHYKPLYIRKKATHLSIALQLLGASRWVLAPAAGTAALAAFGGLLRPSFAGSIFTIWATLFLVSTYLHELAHYYLLRKHRMPADIIRHGLRCGLLHRQLPASQEIATALAGPAVGVLLCLASAIWCTWSNNPLAAFICGASALIHLLSLTPWYGDGLSLRAGLRRLRYQA
jgi:hypothetical protein